MIGIMTAAGKGTRMKALTGKDIPKVLLHINKKPIILYGIESMLDLGITEIYIVANSNYIGLFEKELGHIKEVKIKFIEDNNHIMDSVEELSKFVLSNVNSEDNFVYWLADNIFIGDDHKRAIKELDKNVADRTDPTVGFLLTETKTPQDFITLNSDGTYSEKPIHPETNLSATGVFLINRASLLDTNRRSLNKNQGEYTIWDSWMKKHTIIAQTISDVWVDVGTPERFTEIKHTFENI